LRSSRVEAWQDLNVTLKGHSMHRQGMAPGKTVDRSAPSHRKKNRKPTQSILTWDLKASLISRILSRKSSAGRPPNIHKLAGAFSHILSKGS